MGKEKKARIAIIDREKCIKERCGYQCQSVCPGVRMGEDTVLIDQEGYPVISELLCTGCGICPKRCPSSCIFIINLATEIGNPIYQYKENAFRLYGLPLPQSGIVGLIGKNGIGKSTAIRLLSGQLAPNFATFGKKLSFEEILPRLSPELQNYFKSLAEKKLKVALKPQDISKVAEAFSGTARELLEMSDQRGASREAIGLLSLGDILDRKVSTLSGGELQRLSIAVAYCRQADLYYFDEPSAFLDIKQRLSMAQAIKRLAEGKKAMVVEHDLAIFDYLSDYVHILFGVENAYGVVSSVKASRAGINEYLDGYLKDENIRFRDHAILFSLSPAQESKSKTTMFSYPAMEKKLGQFSFSCDAGSVMEGETIGILGENGTGKSLFVKMLAGIEKPDNCEPPSGMRVSYKPQYLSAEPGVQVAELFGEGKVNAAAFETAKRKLGLASLMDKMLSDLSGGELQRVACALALCKDADIYLFDEPSAFLDIEQRLELADLLQSAISNSKKCAFVIEHDLVMLDAISSRIAVFEGTPGKEGRARSPSDKRAGMNAFLKNAGITLRRDKDSRRPRINKPGSALDREQKEAGEHYYYEG